MSSGGPDLFVICKKCGSEVSPYITECPYCGTRLRKRAPKLDRPPGEPESGPRPRPPRPSLGRLRRNEIPGIASDRRPYATIAVLVCGLGTLLAATVTGQVLARLPLPVSTAAYHGEWWRLVTAPLTYVGVGYAFCALVAIGVFGWLVERRHGWPVAALVMAAGGVGSMAIVTAAQPDAGTLGGNGIALALVGAWVVPDLLARRRGEEVDGDLLGVAVVALVVLLLPLAVADADWLAGVAGGVIGLALGGALTALRPAR